MRMHTEPLADRKSAQYMAAIIIIIIKGRG